tara:strand:- start:314 stop:451 length:138 start_codon:yes stop_codon:yes gene_type:complete
MHKINLDEPPSRLMEVLVWMGLGAICMILIYLIVVLIENRGVLFL